MRLTPNEIAHCIQRTSLPSTEWAVAVAVALAESGGETDALGINDKTTPKPSPLPPTWGSFDCGLWQINNYWHAEKMISRNWRDPYANAELAYLCWLEGKRSWQPWSTFTSRAHEKFLPHAATGLRYPFPVRHYTVPAAPVDLTALTTSLADLGETLQQIRTHFV